MICINIAKTEIKKYAAIAMKKKYTANNRQSLPVRLVGTFNAYLPSTNANTKINAKKGKEENNSAPRRPMKEKHNDVTAVVNKRHNDNMQSRLKNKLSPRVNHRKKSRLRYPPCCIAPTVFKVIKQKNVAHTKHDTILDVVSFIEKFLCD
jgi:hypothetical protein